MGVMPYISASIIVQMMAVVVPQLQELRKEGEAGRRKLTQYTRYGTVGPRGLPGRSAPRSRSRTRAWCSTPGPQFVFIATITLVTGTMFLMWLGEQITERGIGNGISMIILAGIVAGLPAAIGGTLELVRNGEINPALALILVLMVARSRPSSCSSSAPSAASRSTTPSASRAAACSPGRPPTCRSSSTWRA